MGVYIKGMEMPRDCISCCFSDGECGVCDVDKKGHDPNNPADCPLTPVPPHGRLIDADALAETHRTMAEANGGRSYSFHTTAKAWVNEAPTVIEAEEDK